MTAPDYSTWLTKQQAADAIGVSTKTIEKLAQDRQLEQAVWRRPTGGPPLAVFQPDDVARIATARRRAPAPFVLEAEDDQPVRGNGHGTLARAQPVPSGADTQQTVASGLSAFAAALRALLAENSPTSQNSEKSFLTIPEAALATGLSPTFLRRMIKAGTLTAIKDKGWKIRRKDLEAL